MTLQPFLGELRLSQVVFVAPTSAAPDNTLSQNRLNCHRLEERERGEGGSCTLLLRPDQL
jgi:hypothetical protein